MFFGIEQYMKLFSFLRWKHTPQPGPGHERQERRLAQHRRQWDNTPRTNVISRQQARRMLLIERKTERQKQRAATLKARFERRGY